MNLKLKIPIENRGYVQSLREIGEILEKIMDKEVREIFDGYIDEDVVASEEAAAILTLAEIIKAKDAPPKHTIDAMTEGS
jgi:hypothetical protein